MSTIVITVVPTELDWLFAGTLQAMRQSMGGRTGPGSCGRGAQGPAGGRMPGAAEPAKRRAEPGSLDLLEENPAIRRRRRSTRRFSQRPRICYLHLWASATVPGVEADPICDC